MVKVRNRFAYLHVWCDPLLTICEVGHGVKRCDQPVKESSIDEWNIGDNNNETIITQGGWETGTSGVDTVNSWDNPDLIIDTTNSSGADTFLPQAGGDGW